MQCGSYLRKLSLLAFLVTSGFPCAASGSEWMTWNDDKSEATVVDQLDSKDDLTEETLVNLTERLVSLRLHDPSDLETKDILAVIDSSATLKLLQSENLFRLLNSFAAQFKHQKSPELTEDPPTWADCPIDQSCWFETIFLIPRTANFILKSLTLPLPDSNPNSADPSLTYIDVNKFLKNRFFLEVKKDLAVTVEPTASRLALRFKIGSSDITKRKEIQNIIFSLTAEEKNDSEFVVSLAGNIELKGQTSLTRGDLGAKSYSLTFENVQVALNKAVTGSGSVAWVPSVALLQLRSGSEVMLDEDIFVSEIHVEENAFLTLSDFFHSTNPACSDCVSSNQSLRFSKVTLFSLASLEFNSFPVYDPPSVVHVALVSDAAIRFTGKKVSAQFKITKSTASLNGKPVPDGYFWVSNDLKQILFYQGAWLTTTNNQLTFRRPATSLVDLKKGVELANSLSEDASLTYFEESDQEVIARIPELVSQSDDENVGDDNVSVDDQDSIDGETGQGVVGEPSLGVPLDNSKEQMQDVVFDNNYLTQVSKFASTTKQLLDIWQEKITQFNCSAPNTLNCPFKSVFGVSSKNSYTAIQDFNLGETATKFIGLPIFYLDALSQNHTLLLHGSSGKVKISAKNASIILESASTIELDATAVNQLKVTLDGDSNLDAQLKSARAINLQIASCPALDTCSRNLDLEITDSWSDNYATSNSGIKVTLVASSNPEPQLNFRLNTEFNLYGPTFARLIFASSVPNKAVSWSGSISMPKRNDTPFYLPVEITNGDETSQLTWLVDQEVANYDLLFTKRIASSTKFPIFISPLIAPDEDENADASFSVAAQAALVVGQGVILTSEVKLVVQNEIYFLINQPDQVGQLVIASGQSDFQIHNLSLALTTDFVENYLGGDQNFNAIRLVQLIGDDTKLCLASTCIDDELLHQFKVQADPDGEEYSLQLVAKPQELLLRKVENPQEAITAQVLPDDFVVTDTYSSLDEVLVKLINKAAELKIQEDANIKEGSTVSEEAMRSVSRLLLEASWDHIEARNVNNKLNVDLKVAGHWFKDSDQQGRIAGFSINLSGKINLADFGIVGNYNNLQITSAEPNKKLSLYNLTALLGFQTPIDVYARAYLGFGFDIAGSKRGMFVYAGANVKYTISFDLPVKSKAVVINLLPSYALDLAPHFNHGASDLLYSLNRLGLNFEFTTGNLIENLSLTLAVPVEAGWHALLNAQSKKFAYHYFYGKTGLDLQLSAFDAFELVAGYRFRYGKSTSQHSVKISLQISV